LGLGLSSFFCEGGPMKKKDFKKLALIGMTSGFIGALSQSAFLEAKQLDNTPLDVTQVLAEKHKCGKGKCGGIASRDTKKVAEVDPNSQNMGYHLMTEDELMDELNDEGQRLYKKLSPEGKLTARQVASQRCQASNICKGYNACQTPKNDCAGKGECKGTSKCAFADKNLAVKIVSEKMGNKRTDASK
jgi:hypothetical protein